MRILLKLKRWFFVKADAMCINTDIIFEKWYTEQCVFTMPKRRGGGRRRRSKVHYFTASKFNCSNPFFAHLHSVLLSSHGYLIHLHQYNKTHSHFHSSTTLYVRKWTISKSNCCQQTEAFGDVLNIGKRAHNTHKKWEAEARFWHGKLRHNRQYQHRYQCK